MIKFFFVCFLLILFTACGGDKDNLTINKRGGQFTVEGEIVKSKPFSDKITLVVDLLPMMDLELKAPLSGIILQINFREGQAVNKGDLLIRLDDRRSLIQLSALQAEQKLLQNEYDRKKTLQEIEAITLEDLESIQDRLIIVDAEIKALDLSIDMANIRAPFDGKMGMMDWTVGAYVNQGEVLSRLVQNNVLKVNLQIPGAYADELKIGDELLVKAYEDSIHAKVYALSPSMDAYSRTLQVRARLEPQGKPAFISGAFAEVILPIKQNLAAIVVPAKSVLYDINEQTVYTLHQGVVKKKVVQTGIVGSDVVEIVKGLSNGDTLLTSGLLRLKDGMQVGVVFNTPTSPKPFTQ